VKIFTFARLCGWFLDKWKWAWGFEIIVVLPLFNLILTCNPMEVNKIQDGKGKTYIMVNHQEVEKVNPIELYEKIHKASGTRIMRLMGLDKYFPMIKNVLDKLAQEDWEEKYREIMDTKMPENLKQIFNAVKKKDQIKLLKGLSITPDILIAFFFYAWQERGYSFSQYRGEHEREGLNKSELPIIAYIEDGKVERVGESTLTDGQIKQAIQQRTVVNAYFLDKGENWHCLFATHNSLKGEENWQNGQPHFHYISSKFGISREKVIESLKSKYYKLGSLPHVKLTDYRSSTKESGGVEE
jgi:hypothetical protein